MTKYITIFAVALAFFAGVYVTTQHFKARIADMEKAHQAALLLETEKNAKNLSDAASSLALASSQYDAVRTERDSALRRLRQHIASSTQNASAGCADAKRVEELGRMVNELSEMVDRCDKGWHGCASRKDALVEVIK